MINLQADFSEAVAKFRALAQEFRASVAQGFSEVSRRIAEKFRNEDLSGRKSDDTGLNIRTGRLHDSIKSEVEIAENKISGVVYNDDAPYWEFHQKGMGFNPKRLFWEEEFEAAIGNEYAAVVSEAEQAMAAVA